jgi:hypothetical protein
MNYLAIWDHALDHLKQADPAWEQTLAHWRAERPDQKSDRDLMAEYAWVVACCGMTAKAILPRWERLGAALGNWDPPKAAAAPLQEVLAVLNNRRKIIAIQQFAADLASNPGQMARLAAMEPKQALAWLGTLPWVGPNNRHHLARNLGWDTIVTNGPVPRFAAMLQLSSEELCAGIAAETGERIRTVDLLLWHWGNDVGDEAMRQMALLFRIL